MKHKKINGVREVDEMERYDADDAESMMDLGEVLNVRSDTQRAIRNGDRDAQEREARNGAALFLKIAERAVARRKASKR